CLRCISALCSTPHDMLCSRVHRLSARDGDRHSVHRLAGDTVGGVEHNTVTKHSMTLQCISVCDRLQLDFSNFEGHCHAKQHVCTGFRHVTGEVKRVRRPVCDRLQHDTVHRLAGVHNAKENTAQCA